MKDNCCHTKITENKAHELLVENGMSRTKIKTQILMLLSKKARPLSANELYELIGPSTCNISSIFRTLSQFKEKGLINELNLGEDFYRYELSSLDAKDHHHHHVRCRECGDIKHLDKCDLKGLEKFVTKLGFKEIEHYLEFTGICSKCFSKLS